MKLKCAYSEGSYYVQSTYAIEHIKAFALYNTAFKMSAVIKQMSQHMQEYTSTGTYRHRQIQTTTTQVQVSHFPHHFLHLVSTVFYIAVSLSHPLAWGQAGSHVLLNPLPRGTCSHPVTDTHSLHHIPLDSVTPMHTHE